MKRLLPVKIVMPVLLLAFMLAATAIQAKPHHPAPNPKPARSFSLDPLYVRPDGAIMTWTGSEVIDPYFPTKALLVAQDNGFDISDLGKRWVEWMLARQDVNGLFGRYCFNKEKNAYNTCAVADADDSMMAMWVELLYRLAPRGGLPDAWKASAEKAQYQLDLLFNPKTIAFSVSKAMPVGLLMDNMEIYAAYKSIERSAIRIGDSKTALAYRARATYLRNGIAGTFWDPKAKRFKASTQARTGTSFYPDDVVQLIPIMYGYSSPVVTLPKDFYKTWMKQHRAEWFNLIGKDYPWGLLAVIAADHGDTMTANCWLQQSTPFRHSQQWSVLDEASFQSVEWKLHKKWPHELPACKLPAKEGKKP